MAQNSYEFVSQLDNAHNVYQIIVCYLRAKGISVVKSEGTGLCEIPSSYVWECSAAVALNDGRKSRRVGLEDLFDDIDEIVRLACLNRERRKACESSVLKRARKRIGLILSQFK